MKRILIKSWSFKSENMQSRLRLKFLLMLWIIAKMKSARDRWTNGIQYSRETPTRQSHQQLFLFNWAAILTLSLISAVSDYYDLLTPAFIAQKRIVWKQPVTRHEINSRTHPKFTFIPESTQRTWARSQRCVKSEKNRTTLERAPLIS